MTDSKLTREMMGGKHGSLPPSPSTPDLAAAARRLLNEVIGMSGAYGDEIRGVVGNTNFNVLKMRADELDAALRKAADLARSEGQ